MEKTKNYDHDYSLEPVAAKDKKGMISMLTVMLGFTFFSASMWAGGTLGTSINFKEFILSVLVGNSILAVYAGALAYISSKTSLSTHLLAKYSFGEKGSYLVSFLLSATQVGWFGVGVAMFAVPVQKITGINIYVLIGLSGILMTSSAYLGITTIAILGIIAVPSIVVLGGYSSVLAINSVGGMHHIMAITPANTMTIATALTLCIGSFASGATLTADFTRFSKTNKISVISTVVAFIVGNSLMFFFGAIGAAVTGKSDISDVMVLQGLIVPAIIVLGLNIWTTNNNALYASGLGFSNITKIPKKKIVLFNGVVGTILALWLYNNFTGWLTFLGTAIPPIGGILIVDYFIINKGIYDDFKTVKFTNINWSAIGAWIIGTLVGSLVPVGVIPINSVLAGALSYYAINVFVQKKNVSKSMIINEEVI